jgi:hypothetical protein
MTWTSRALVGLAAAAALAVACGGSGATSSSSTKSSPTPSPTKATLITGPIDACLLVTASDASTATGVTMTALAPGSSGLCLYSGQTDTTSASVFVYAQAYPDTTTADAISPDQMAALLSGQVGIANAKAVTGIGDKAVEYTATSSSSTGSGIVIFVFKANVVLFIVVSPTTDATKVEALARTAVANLPKS